MQGSVRYEFDGDRNGERRGRCPMRVRMVRQNNRKAGYKQRIRYRYAKALLPTGARRRRGEMRLHGVELQKSLHVSLFRGSVQRNHDTEERFQRIDFYHDFRFASMLRSRMLEHSCRKSSFSLYATRGFARTVTPTSTRFTQRIAVKRCFTDRVRFNLRESRSRRCSKRTVHERERHLRASYRTAVR